jgi:hypothetical protein
VWCRDRTSVVKLLKIVDEREGKRVLISISKLVMLLQLSISFDIFFKFIFHSTDVFYFDVWSTSCLLSLPYLEDSKRLYKDLRRWDAVEMTQGTGRLLEIYISRILLIISPVISNLRLQLQKALQFQALMSPSGYKSFGLKYLHQQKTVYNNCYCYRGWNLCSPSTHTWYYKQVSSFSAKCPGWNFWSLIEF